MNKDKALVRHELLNLLTLVNFEISTSKLEGATKADIGRNLKALGLLISYEDMLLGKKYKLHERSFPILEVLELLLMIHENHIKAEKIKVSLPKQDLLVKTDRKILQDALEQIFVRVMGLSKKINFKVKGQKLLIEYGSKVALEMVNMELLECIRTKACNDHLPYHLAVRLLRDAGIKVKFSAGLVELTLPKGN